jgi:mono/diheme cytochrome c family protein
VPCHGDRAGDGPQHNCPSGPGPAADVARAASPADWFKTVSRAILAGSCPRSGSLTDQQRWDVVAYALTLHVPAGQASRGQSLIESGCADCPAAFSDQEKMAALSEKDLVAMLRIGSGSQAAFGKGLSDDDAYAVAEYLRSLTFSAAPKVASASTPAAPQGPTIASAPETGARFAPAATPPALGEVTGSIRFPATSPRTRRSRYASTMHRTRHRVSDVLTVSASASATARLLSKMWACPESLLAGRTT